MGNGQDPVTLHKYLYANGNPVMNIDPSGYYSMVEISSAMGVQNSLQNMQIGAYSTFTNAITGGWDGVSMDNIPELALTFVGAKLLIRYLPKLFGCKNSFDGTTLVSTEKGLIPIQEIQIGDKVWAYNEVNQTKSLQKVIHLIRGEHYKELIDIELISGEIITTTDNHPFWTIDTESWIEADNLTNRNILLNINDQNTTINSLKYYNDKKKVYNLTIENIHTYYVGLDGVLGHNCEIDYGKIKYPRSPKVGKNFTLKQKNEALKLNRLANNGEVKSDLTGKSLVKPEKSMRGVTPNPDEWQFDHIIAKKNGGTNSGSNLQILSRHENRQKSDN